MSCRRELRKRGCPTRLKPQFFFFPCLGLTFLLVAAKKSLEGEEGTAPPHQLVGGGGGSGEWRRMMIYLVVVVVEAVDVAVVMMEKEIHWHILKELESVNVKGNTESTFRHTRAARTGVGGGWDVSLGKQRNYDLN